MKTLKVYIENSVIGGYFDGEFENASKILFEYFRNGIYKPIISSHVMFELNNGASQYVLDNLDTINYEYIELNKEMEDLAEIYLKNNIVSENIMGMHYI
ncbi:MAG: hypothetical protein LBM96_13055 [Methanobrevibacter sp.]|jgi:hypothetical protein|nr:hypothetical protein [Candidatus Methanoflexus mossambicus]